MVKLKRKYESCIGLNPYFESKQDEERLKAYLGDDLFNQYMDIRKKLPNLSNQFKDFTKINFDTGNSDKDNETKKDLVDSYNRLLKYLPKNKQDLFKPLEGVNPNSVDRSDLEEILNTYKEARDIVFKDQARFRDFGQLSKIPVADIQNWVDTFSTNRYKKQQDKVDGADKLYEDGDWSVYRITTYPAAQLYGSNTKWCITGRYPGYEGRGEKYFNDYIRDKNLDGGYYFYINKKDPNVKYCVLQTKDKEIDSIWDAEDTNRGSSYEELLEEDDIELPEVKEVNLSKYSTKGLIEAIRENNLAKVKEYLINGVDPKMAKASPLGTSALKMSVLDGKKDIVDLLLKYGADPNEKDYAGRPLLDAAQLDIDMAELLLKNGADPNIINDQYGIQQLIIAVDEGKKSLVDLLLKYGADPNIKDKEGRSSLDHALGVNKDIVELLLKNGAEFNNRSFLEAVAVGDSTLVELLLKRGLNPNIKSEKTGNTVLHIISWDPWDMLYGKDRILANLLLSYKADPNIKNSLGDTPLSLAVKENKKDLVELLLKNGADPNIKNNNGNSILTLAYKEGNEEIVELLKKYGARE